MTAATTIRVAAGVSEAYVRELTAAAAAAAAAVGAVAGAARAARRPPAQAASAGGICRRLVPPRGVAQSGSAPGWGPGGRRFKSCLPDYESPAKAGFSGLPRPGLAEPLVPTSYQGTRELPASSALGRAGAALGRRFEGARAVDRPVSDWVRWPRDRHLLSTAGLSTRPGARTNATARGSPLRALASRSVR